MNPAAYLEAMTRLMRESNLRAELIEKGRQHAARFSWSRCAEETNAVYEQALR